MFLGRSERDWHMLAEGYTTESQHASQFNAHLELSDWQVVRFYLRLLVELKLVGFYTYNPMVCHPRNPHGRTPGTLRAKLIPPKSISAFELEETELVVSLRKPRRG